MSDPAPNGSADSRHFEEVLARFLQAEEHGLRPDPRSYLENYPELADRLRAFFRDREWFDLQARQLAPRRRPPASARARTPGMASPRDRPTYRPAVGSPVTRSLRSWAAAAWASSTTHGSCRPSARSP
jgi:hypothetical protein